MNGTEKIDGFAKYTPIPYLHIHPQERSETQLQNARGPQTAKALGFSLFLVDVASRKQVGFSMICVFWGVSVQPNLQNLGVSSICL